MHQLSPNLATLFIARLGRNDGGRPPVVLVAVGVREIVSMCKRIG
jgi:hypothetical protein